MIERSFLQDYCLVSTTTYMGKTIKKEVGFQFMGFIVEARFEVVSPLKKNVATLQKS